MFPPQDLLFLEPLGCPRYAKDLLTRRKVAGTCAASFGVELFYLVQDLQTSSSQTCRAFLCRQFSVNHKIYYTSRFFLLKFVLCPPMWSMPEVYHMDARQNHQPKISVQPAATMAIALFT